MGRIISNKHIDDASKLTRDIFDADENLAKGEIIINNDSENPSIYILNNEGNVAKITGGGTGGSDYDDTAIWAQVNQNTEDIKEIKENGTGNDNAEFADFRDNEYTPFKNSTENALTGLSENVSRLTDGLSGLSTDFASLSGEVKNNKTTLDGHDKSIGLLNKGVSDLNSTIELIDQEIVVLKDTATALGEYDKKIDAYTINGKTISENPVLDTDDIKISDDYTTNITSENIIPADLLTTAIAKIEITLAKTTLALTAGLNDLDMRLGTPAEYDDKNQISKKSTGVYEAIDSIINNMALLHPDVYNPSLSDGGQITLYNSYRPTTPVILSGDTALELNLNNQKVIAPTFTESNGEILEGNTDSYAFWVKEGAELTIDGEGEVIAQPAEYSMSVWANGGTVTINGGKFYNGGDGCDLIYASNGGKVYIYGGEFHATERIGNEPATKNKYSALNIKDKDRDICEIVVYGGKFYGFDPANNLSEGPGTNFVADGYKSVEVETGVWEVMPE